MRKIKEYREKLGISQKELAGRIGVSQVMVCHYESGLKTPDVSRLKMIADALHCTMDELVS